MGLGWTPIFSKGNDDIHDPRSDKSSHGTIGLKAPFRDVPKRLKRKTKGHPHPGSYRASLRIRGAATGPIEGRLGLP